MSLWSVAKCGIWQEVINFALFPSPILPSSPPTNHKVHNYSSAGSIINYRDDENHYRRSISVVPESSKWCLLSITRKIISIMYNGNIFGQRCGKHIFDKSESKSLSEQINWAQTGSIVPRRWRKVKSFFFVDKEKVEIKNEDC